MQEIFIIGVGMTRFGRWPDTDIKALTRMSVSAAIEDAGIKPDAIDAAFFANATQGHMEGQDMIRGQIALRAMGIASIPIVNVENACASGATAFQLAVASLKAGEHEIVLAIGAEKMLSKDKDRTLSAFHGAWDVATQEANQCRLLELGTGIQPPPGTMSEKPYSVFMDVYAAFARHHMAHFGTTQRQLAAVSAKNHGHSVHNTLAQFRRPYTVEEVLAAAPIAFPLTLPMCSPVSDGSAAVVLASTGGMKRLGIDGARAVRVLATVLQSGSDRRSDQPELHCTVRAATRAYEAAGIGPNDVSVAEVHDATAMGEIIQTENLGFCRFGDGGPIAERGETSVGGRLPINASGGLESKGHPIGASGLAQLHELVLQLRGEAGARQVHNARIGLAENGGGLIGIEEAAAVVTILGK